MAFTAAFICSGVSRASSYSTSARREARFTLAACMPSSELRVFSTWAEHDEQAMPTTGIVFFCSIL